MKTRLLKELRLSPVELGTRTAYSDRTMLVNESSSLIPDTTETTMLTVEEYRIGIRFNARWQVQAHTHPDIRNLMHEKMMRSISEQVYGEVRSKVYEMYPVLREVRGRDAEDISLINQVADLMQDILEMTKP